MKIRNRHLIRAAGWLGTKASKCLIRSQRIDHHRIGDGRSPRELPPGSTVRHIYAIWHENLLLPTVHFGDPSLAVLISKHADGQILGSLITAMGMGMVQGSTNRGGIAAVRELINDPNARRHLAVTPDGPRGPRREVQPGCVYVASRAGMSIICVGVGYRRPWRLKSWDRFAVPKPGGRATCILADPIVVPAGLKSEQLEVYRRQVQAEMDRVSTAAEVWADSGKLSLVPRSFSAAA
jgi:lysophospholipid acyltransferase (LPLAT)-like uncharacterized protein